MQNDVATQPERDALPPEELHDVTIVALASNDLESECIVDLLEESGIPTMNQRWNVRYGLLATNTEIRVPRVFAAQARAIIANFRANVAENRVVEAFDEANIAENLNDRQREPLIDRLHELSYSEKEVRDLVLIDLLVDWLAAETTDIQIANYLAVAGCTPVEAHELLVKVRKFRAYDLKDKLEKKMCSSYGVAALGAVGIIASLKFFGFFELALIVLVTGLGLAAHYKAKLRALS